MRDLTLILVYGLLAVCGEAVEFAEKQFGGRRHVVCTVDLKAESLHLFLKNEAGGHFHHFEKIEAALAPHGRRLIFWMNAGMFHPDFAPVGLCIDRGRALGKLNLANAEGNFFLKPNGVFAVTEAGAIVAEAARFAERVPEADYRTVKVATQSGPMLVIDGKLHPAFRADSASRLFRNGVGLLSPERVVFAISAEPVNFYEFATLFRDGLGCRDALFLDGTLCALHAPPLQRSDKPFPLGPILGITAPLAE